MADLLTFAGTVRLQGISEPFKVSDRFVVNTSDAAKVKISGIGSNFKRMFGKMTVGSCAGSSLSRSALTRAAYDEDILAALGGKVKAKSTISEIWQFLELQPNYENGYSLNDGQLYLFYVLDEEQVLRAVFVFRFGNGWRVDARELVYGYWVGFSPHRFSLFLLFPVPLILCPLIL
jgi:hypothetical protein